MNDDHSKEIGALLKAKRLELGHTLEGVAERTRIRKGYIKSMESGCFSDLPGHAYVTGFIRVYAGYLGLDSAELLNMLEEASPVEDEMTPPVIVSAPEQKAAGRTTKGGGWVSFVVGFIAVLILGGVVYFFMPVPDVPQVDTESDEPARIEEPAPLKEPTLQAQEEEQTAAPAEQEMVAPEIPDAPASVVEESQPPQEVTFQDVKRDGSSLRMLAMFDSSLIIYVDKRKPQPYKLYEGLDLTWKVAGRVRVEMDAPGAARFWLDGKEVKLGEHPIFELVQAP